MALEVRDRIFRWVEVVGLIALVVTALFVVGYGINSLANAASEREIAQQRAVANMIAERVVQLMGERK